MKKNSLFVLGFIVLLAAVLRFWGLATTPPSMYWDEVSQGYNAYSILKTGYDEHHEFFPIARFIAFGDYKAPVYIYFDVPFIALFGKTTLGVRFPSALFGTFTVIFAFFLMREIFFWHKKRDVLGITASFLLAISPWHIQLSRVAYEANVATFFTVLGIFLFFLGKRTKKLLLITSVISFVVAFYAFNAHRIFIPFIIFLLGILYFRELFSKQYIAITAFSTLIALVILVPFVMYFITPQSRLRFQEVNIFSDSRIVQQANSWISQENNSLLAKILHNRRILFAREYIKHYLDFFNPAYLFFSGDVNPRFSLQDNGELFLWELPLIMLGLYFLAVSRKKEALFIFGWFVLAPIAAATARETPHALRSETYIPIYEIFAAFGSIWIIEKIQKLKKIYVGVAILATLSIIVFSVTAFVHDYFIHFPTFYSQDFQYGYKQAVSYVEEVKNNYDTISFTSAYGRPYIYVLFYGDETPQNYWKNAIVTRDAFGFYAVTKIGKYEFRKKLQMPEDTGKKVLYIGSPQETIGLKRIKTIYFLNGKEAFVLAQN